MKDQHQSRQPCPSSKTQHQPTQLEEAPQIVLRHPFQDQDSIELSVAPTRIPPVTIDVGLMFRHKDCHPMRANCRFLLTTLETPPMLVHLLPKGAHAKHTDQHTVRLQPDRQPDPLRTSLSTPLLHLREDEGNLPKPEAAITWLPTTGTVSLIRSDLRTHHHKDLPTPATHQTP